MVVDYRAAYGDFDHAAALAVMHGCNGKGVNAAFECCDRWCGMDRVALRWADGHGRRGEISFDELRATSSRYAHLLASLGVAPGDRVAGLLPRTPALLAVIVATWRLGAVYQPLFTAFGPRAIAHRIEASGATVIVTDPANRAKLVGMATGAVIVVTERSTAGTAEDVVLGSAAADLPEDFAPVPRTLDDPFLMMFTSGTTGAAKSLLVPLRAIAAFVAYMRDAVGLLPQDRFWNIADPGWAYGLYYGVTGPLAIGQTTLFYDGGFTAQVAVDIIREFRITNLAGAPTAFRQLVLADPEVTAPIAGQLIAVSSAGEPLNPDIIAWFRDSLGVPLHDHYGQTELGMVVCNHHRLSHPITPGSAGFAVPGHRVVVLGDDDVELPPRTPGILAVDRSRSSLFWFGGYGDAARDAGRYYRSGDTVERNDDGSLSFVGRSDDVITSSGYRIGPFDVESALAEHPVVAEAAVIGKPGPERTEIVEAFVVLRQCAEPDADLAIELQRHVRQRLSAHAYPREVTFVDALPKTPSGKIQRFLLRAQEMKRAEASPV